MSERQRWTYTMDYETNEIVMTTYVDGEKMELRACEKDVKSMQRWFDLARAMAKAKE